MNKKKTNTIQSIINQKDLQELGEFLPLNEKQPKKEVVPIIYDEKYTRQYSLKIPKKIAEAAQINVVDDRIEFELSIPDKPNDVPQLRATLIRKWQSKKDLTNMKEKS
jgi:hypothetical protein